MAEYKSLEYLAEIKNKNLMTQDDLVDALQNIAYILADNGYNDARYFLDEIAEAIEDGEIEV